jgi:quercetin dioxygenase-like cupin family protein
MEDHGGAEVPMEGIQVRSFDAPDETRPYLDRGRIDVLTIAGHTVGRGVFEPGWRWSTHVKPIAKTDSCQVAHLGYAVSGRMRVVMDDGSETEIGPGEVFAIPPGHDAEVVGDELCDHLGLGQPKGYAKAD